MGNEWKVIASLLLAVIGLEMAARRWQGNVSKDVASLLALPDELRQWREEDKFKVLIVGNSLARRGVDRQVFEHAGKKLAGRWKARGAKDRGISCLYFCPDSSSVTEWAWGLGRYFSQSEDFPDLIVVVTARGHLVDGPVSPGRLGAYLLGENNFKEALKIRPDFESKLRLILGRYSRLYAIRDRVRPNFGYRFLPGFAEAWPAVAADRRAIGADEGKSESNAAVGISSLKRLIDESKRMGAPVYFVTVPLPEPYVLRAEVVELLEARNQTLLDLSDVEGISAKDFPDGYHLDELGARVFTAALIDELAKAYP